MRVQPDVDAHLSYVEGRAPTGNVRQIANPLDPSREVATDPGVRDRDVAVIRDGDRRVAR